MAATLESPLSLQELQSRVSSSGLTEEHINFFRLLMQGYLRSDSRSFSVLLPQYLGECDTQKMLTKEVLTE